MNTKKTPSISGRRFMLITHYKLLNLQHRPKFIPVHTTWSARWEFGWKFNLQNLFFLYCVVLIILKPKRTRMETYNNFRNSTKGSIHFACNP